MALQSLATYLIWPGIIGTVNAPATAGHVNLDAAGEYCSFIDRATENMTISHVGFTVHTSGSGTTPLDIRIETVDAATGLPSGTLWATDTSANTGALGSGGTWTVTALTASATINAGDYYCVRFSYNSGTLIGIRRAVGMSKNAFRTGLPYWVNNTGTPAKASNSHVAFVAVGSSSTAWYMVDFGQPLLSVASVSINNTTQSAFGLRFKVPYKCRCIGIAARMGNTLGTFTVGMYDDSGTEISSSSTTVDPDILNVSNATDTTLKFDNPITLSPDTWYRAALWPTSATDINLYVVTHAGSDVTEALWCGANFHYTRRSTGGTWTDTGAGFADSFPLIDLMVDQLDDGVSAGGGLKLAGRGGLAG